MMGRKFKKYGPLHARLMEEAIERYLEVHRGTYDNSICDWGGDRNCLVKEGALCWWCQLDAAVTGQSYTDIEQLAEEQKS